MFLVKNVTPSGHLAIGAVVRAGGYPRKGAGETMATLVLDGWAGRERIPCEVVGETPKRYRIKLLQDANLPSRRSCKAGDVVLVPRYAVRLDELAAEGDQT